MGFARPSLLALVLVAAACSSQQQPPPQQAQQSSASGAPRACTSFNSAAPAALKESKDYHEAALTVFDSNGPVSTLSREDLTVEADGRDAPVEYLEYLRNAPASVVIAVDTSGSTVNIVAQERTLLGSLIEALDSHDELALIAFSGRPYLLQSLTTDHDVVKKRLSLLHAYGQTALYDSLIEAIKIAARGCYTQAAVVLITDTSDNVSTERADDVSRIARENNVRIYVITMGGKIAAPISIGRLLGGPDDGYNPKQAKAVADQISQPTGGRALVLPPSPDDTAVSSAAQSLAQDIGGAYVIGFTGTPADLKVQVKNHPDYVVEVMTTAAGG